MKKGFTLVELLAVIVILGLIALIVYPSIGSVIHDSKEKAYNEQINVIIKAAKTYALDHAKDIPDNGSEKAVTVATLVSEGYISNDDVKDPRNSSKTLTGSVLIKYNGAYNQYEYTYKE